MNKNKKNILLSAYACEPNRGSESEVGWKWSINLIKSGFNVFVVTRKNNKSKIEKEIKKRNYKNLHFLYFDFPKWFIKIIKGKNTIRIIEGRVRNNPVSKGIWSFKEYNIWLA